MRERQPIRVTSAESMPPEGAFPPHVAHAMGITALYFAAVDLRSRKCPDCGNPFVVVEDDDHEAFTASLGCPPACPRYVGVTSGILPIERT